MSTLFVNNISHTNDTAALAINTTGTITPSKMVYASFTLSGNHSGTAGGYETITNWTTLSAPHTTLGASMTHSSGTFTFPHTGKYLITLHAGGYGDGGARTYSGGQIKYSGDSGGSYTNLARGIASSYTATAYFQATATVLIEITNTSTQSIRFNGYTAGNIILVHNDNNTMCLFQQVG